MDATHLLRFDFIFYMYIINCKVLNLQKKKKKERKFDI